MNWIAATSLGVAQRGSEMSNLAVPREWSPLISIHITYLTSPHLTSFHRRWARCDWLQPWWTGSLQSAQSSLPRLQTITGHSVQMKLDEMRWVEMRWGEVSNMNIPITRMPWYQHMSTGWCKNGALTLQKMSSFHKVVKYLTLKVAVVKVW